MLFKAIINTRVQTNKWQNTYFDVASNVCDDGWVCGSDCQGKLRNVFGF